MTFCRVLFLLMITAMLGSPDNAWGQVFEFQPKVLFDGQSKSGWGKANGDPHPGWVVQNGALFRQSGGGDLFYQETFRDYVLHFQFRISDGGNSGLKYRVRQYGRAWLGCEYQILDDADSGERNKTGCLYDVYQAADHKPQVFDGVWHNGTIVVAGDRIEHWLDGVQIVTARVGSPEWNRKIEDSKFRNRKGFGQNREGRIFLQDHGNPVWFRDIVLVPIDPDQSPIIPDIVPIPGG